MSRFWDLIICGLLEAVLARRVVEVGVASGLVTMKLLAYCEARGAVLHAIDPQPELDIGEWSERYGDRLVFHRARSLDVLADIHGVDAVLIDGDHNWYTVYHELATLEKTAVRDGNVPPLVVLHDVDWPYGRRDMYYTPETIPAAYRQPHRRAGLIPGQSEPGSGGANSAFENAVTEGSEHNGVRTAIEDFAEQSRLDWQVSSVPGYHGLGILVTADRVRTNPELAATIARVRTEQFLEPLARELELARLIASIGAGNCAAEAAELRVRVTDLERELEVTREEAERVGGEARELEQQVSESQRVLSDVLNSSSWRATQPFRRAKHTAFRARDVLRRLAADARRD